MDLQAETVLVTGGSGFLGQHVIKELQRAHAEIKLKEIRVVDLKSYSDVLNVKEYVPIKHFQLDISGDITNMRDVFSGVTCVIHCAALVSYEYPGNRHLLWHNNVKGTTNIVNLCKDHDIQKLIFTSSAEVCYSPYIGSTCITILINQTEARARARRRTLTEYAASKLEAESIILKANGLVTNNGYMLRSVALRPPLIYGEEDNGLITSMVKIGHSLGVVPRIAGSGGKHQTIYAGNVAWAHVCAMKTLQREERYEISPHHHVSGLPVFITDDTTVADVTRLCERFTTPEGESKPLVKQSWWSVPILLSFILALFLQIIASLLSMKVPVSPRALISYLGSIILFNRTRASTRLQYSPLYTEKESIHMSSKYYVNLYRYLEKNKLYHH